MEGGVLDASLRLLAVFGLVFANGFFVAAEFAIVTVRKTRIDQRIAEGSRLARWAQSTISEPDRYIAATQLGITMTSLGLGWIGEPAVATLILPITEHMPAPLASTTSHSVAVAVAFALITSLHIVLGELAPKTIALQHPERTALIVAVPAVLFTRVFWPFIALLNGTGRAVVTLLGIRPPDVHALVHSEEELKMLVTASQQAGVLEEHEERMLHRVFGFGDFTAGHVMIPRTEMVALSVGASWGETVDIVSAAPYNQVPVFREGLDDIVGVVHIKELFRVLQHPPEHFGLTSLIHQVLTVPETLTADEVLARMQKLQKPCAIVIDEYGGTAGMVTFELLVERIVGEFGAGSEPGSHRIVMLADGSAIIDGLTLVRDVNQRFDLHLEKDLYNTLGGYVLGRVGRRAQLGDQIEVERRILRVEALDGLRVSRVFLSRPAADLTPEAQ